MMHVYIYTKNITNPGATLITNVNQEDVHYFVTNNIKVSMETLNDSIVVYGCPHKDISEESEVIVFSNGRSCRETLAELAIECKKEFGDVNGQKS